VGNIVERSNTMERSNTVERSNIVERRKLSDIVWMRNPANTVTYIVRRRDMVVKRELGKPGGPMRSRKQLCLEIILWDHVMNMT
jgi:hypothetical protein